MNPERRDFDELRPSATDAARDALDDLAACDRVPEPPWETRPGYGLPHHTRVVCNVTRRPDGSPWGSNDVCRVNTDFGEVKAEQIAEFIALARAALPAWVRRAAHAEALNRRYCEMLRRLVDAYQFRPFELPAVAEGVAEEALDLWSE